MWYYFFGFLFVFLDFDVTIGGVTLYLQPDFIGYLLVMLGNRRMHHENDHFRRLRILTPVAFLLSLAQFILLLVLPSAPAPVALVTRIVTTVCALYITYEFSEAAKTIERGQYKKLEADKISTAWVILCMTALLNFVSFYFPDVSLLCLVVHWASMIWFEIATHHFIKNLNGKKKP